MLISGQLLVFILALIVSVLCKFLRINEWHTINLGDNGSAVIDLHLFASCQKFSIVFATFDKQITRFHFVFNDYQLTKIDIDSEANGPIPRHPKLSGSCREKTRKTIRINLDNLNSSMTRFQIGDQTFRRPFDHQYLRILAPQTVACCLIRGLYLADDEHIELPPIVFDPTPPPLIPDIRVTVATEQPTTIISTKFVPMPAKMRTNIVEVLNDTIDWNEMTIGEPPQQIAGNISTVKPKIQGSWTHLVNKEWSITFVFCAIIVCVIMLFLVVFGTFMFFYLMTKPKGGKSPFAIDA